MSRILACLLLIVSVNSCKTPSGVFAKKTLHEEYGNKLTDAGLAQTVLGRTWFEAASKALSSPVAIQLPYKETGYFAPDRPTATGLQFSARRGEQIIIEVSKVPATNYLLFTDLFTSNGGTNKLVQSTDSANNTIRYTVRDSGSLSLRLQPELLKSGSYTLVITTAPSLAFPVANPSVKNRIISMWGADRDAGARSHQGVDIGGNRGTPVVAVGNGYVTSVTENNLGGKVVFIRSDEANETWYYAHLDSQIAIPGQRVNTGDVVGLIGNTGNARTTAPHLHFGIYTSGGAVNPLPYLEAGKKNPKDIAAPISALGNWRRVASKPFLTYSTPDTRLPGIKNENIPVLVIGATGNLYKTILPGGELMFVPAASTIEINKRINKLTLKEAKPIHDAPDENAPVIKTLSAGSSVDLLGIYNNFQFIAAEEQRGWVRL